MHIAGGAAIAGLGGGSVAAGAAGAGVSAALAGNLNDVSNAIAGASPTGNADADGALGNIIANALATGAGAVVGGNSGRAIGSSVDMYNAREHCTNQKCEGSTPGSISAGLRNGVVSIAEMAVNLPNGGPFATPGDPGYISLDGLRVPYAPGDQIGPGVEFFAAALATRGVGKGTAAEAEAEAEAQAALRIAQAASSNSISQADLATLAANGVKFTPQNVVTTGTTSAGQTVFLETGNAGAGLQHIIQEHGAEFASMGVSSAQIPDVIMQTVTQGEIVGYQGAGTGRPIYEVTINSQQQRIAVTVGSNGYIVGANPRGSAR